jgi:hypothetical protein
LPYAEAE